MQASLCENPNKVWDCRHVPDISNEATTPGNIANPSDLGNCLSNMSHQLSSTWLTETEGEGDGASERT